MVIWKLDDILWEIESAEIIFTILCPHYQNWINIYQGPAREYI